MDNFSDNKYIFEPFGYYRFSTKNKIRRKKILLGCKAQKRRSGFVDFLIYGGAGLIISMGVGIYLIIHVLTND